MDDRAAHRCTFPAIARMNPAATGNRRRMYIGIGTLILLIIVLIILF
jgi:hypothetical protein